MGSRTLMSLLLLYCIARCLPGAQFLFFTIDIRRVYKCFYHVQVHGRVQNHHHVCTIQAFPPVKLAYMGNTMIVSFPLNKYILKVMPELVPVVYAAQAITLHQPEKTISYIYA